ncbi:MAG: hypothetical protein ACXVNM_01145 [Bacteroidia bacterium]
MGKKSTNWGWFWLIVALLALFFWWLISQTTDNPKVKERRAYYKDEAEELKRQIYDQSKVVERIRTELRRAQTIQGYLIIKAKRICFAIRCASGVLILGLIFLVHGLMNFSLMEIVGTTTATVSFLYMIVSGVIWNEIKDVNRVLALFYEVVLRMIYSNHRFEPVFIEVLEQKLMLEEQKLTRMKVKYEEIINSKSIN